MRAAEGKRHVMVDVVHDASLSGAPDCFGVQRVDAKVVGCRQGSEGAALYRPTLRVLRTAMREFFPALILSTPGFLPCRVLTAPAISLPRAAETLLV
jgi:hypothetical protein